MIKGGVTACSSEYISNSYLRSLFRARQWMAADRLSCCQAPAVLKWVQKVHGEFAILLSCLPPQLFVRVFAVLPFPYTWIHTMGDPQALPKYSVVTSRCGWPRWEPVTSVYSSCPLQGDGVWQTWARGMGWQGDARVCKHFLTRSEQALRKGEGWRQGGLWQSVRVSSLFASRCIQETLRLSLLTPAHFVPETVWMQSVQFVVKSTRERCCL